MIKEIDNSIKPVKELFIEIGGISFFTVQVLRQLFHRPYEHKEMFKQAYYAGNKTLPLIAVTGFIMGLVLTLQVRPVLVEIGSESILPGMISVSIIREIGPVIAALLCAGKIGSGYGAEISSMRVTEQLDAMEVSGTNPMSYVVMTRVIATTLMVPVLVFMADALAIFGSYIAVNMNADISLKLFLTQAYAPLSFRDLMPATIKTVIFGFVIGMISSYKGYYSKRGTEAVGSAANEAVVYASLAIFVIDLIVVQITELFYG
ncbi:MAG: MlaE family ABC transporter permease [Bacteroidales bacterium]